MHQIGAMFAARFQSLCARCDEVCYLNCLEECRAENEKSDPRLRWARGK